jgi:hypothetical protein
MMILAGVLCVAALVLWFGRSPLRPWLELKELERQAKKNVDVTELRQWAMNLIARHSGEITHWDEYYGTNFYSGTNFPSGLRKIGCFSHGMHILTTDWGPDVAIFGMTKGGPFLQVGALSLAAPTNHTFVQWEPGIYFVGE